MVEIIKSPPAEESRKWGVLAHVNAAERQRILEMPAYLRKHAIAQLERDIRAAGKRR